MEVACVILDGCWGSLDSDLSWREDKDLVVFKGCVVGVSLEVGVLRLEVFG